MSARVLNPMLMTDMSRRGGGLTGGRVVPTKAELAPVRRDLFGPVDHEANRALAERELRAQSRLDAERWGFDFQLGLPRRDARYAWEVVTPNDVVPEPYALRGMPYIRKHAPSTPRKITSSRNNHSAVTKKKNNINNNNNNNNVRQDDIQHRLDDENDETVVIAVTATATATTTTTVAVTPPRHSEMTPPQELRVPDISANRSCEITPEESTRQSNLGDKTNLKQNIEDPTTPVLPVSARKQSAITDFMKNRKRTLNGSSPKIIGEPPEKLSRNAGQIRS